MNLTPALSQEYIDLYGDVQIHPSRLPELDGIIRQIVAHQDRYAALEATTTVPWYVIALIHNLECSLDFGQHLANGDSLQHRTHNDPAGLIVGIDPPYTFEQGAVAALHFDHLDSITDWPLDRICYEFEAFNGFGYRTKGIHSPYLWSGCQHYVSGKYVSDHNYDPDAVSDQIGSAVILYRMTSTGVVTLKATAA